MNFFSKNLFNIKSLTSSSLSQIALNKIKNTNNTTLKKSVFNNAPEIRPQESVEQIKKNNLNSQSKLIDLVKDGKELKQVKKEVKEVTQKNKDKKNNFEPPSNLSDLIKDGKELKQENKNKPKALNDDVDKKNTHQTEEVKERWEKEAQELERKRTEEKLIEEKEIEQAKKKLNEHIQDGVDKHNSKSKKTTKKNEELIESTKKEAERRQKIIQDRLDKIKEDKLEKSKNNIFSPDSIIGKLLEKRKKRINKKKVKERDKILTEKKIKEKEAEELKKSSEKIIEDYEFNKMLFDNDVFEVGSSDYEELQNFFDDKINEVNYEQAKLNLEGKNAPNYKERQKEIDKKREEVNKEKIKQKEIKYKEDTDFANKYVNTYREIEDLNPNENNYGNFTKEEYEAKYDYIEQNKEKFNSLDEEIVDKAINDFDIKEGEDLFAARESRLKNKLKSDKEELRNVNRQIKELKKNRSQMSEEEFISQINDLASKKNDIKSNIKESRKNYRSRKNPNTYKNEINQLNKEIKSLENIDALNAAKNKLNSGEISEEDFLNIKTQLFGDKEPKKPNRTREEIEKEIQKNKKILKSFGEEVLDAEEDIVDKFKNKMKTTSKANLVFSGINAIVQYKDSRKEGKSVVGSVARAGLDFAFSEILGGPTYMALSFLSAAPGLAIKGTEALHREVRNMNTASRFTVFGEAQFQDTEQLATMRQSGMELAKMSQYRLEQTIMGNEARYLHR